MGALKVFVGKNIVYFVWLQALVATLGSLYLSEVQQLVPCLLCWYQRIFMYPIVFISTVGIIRRDKALPFYILPLSIGGGLIAAYHYLIQRGILPEKIVSCAIGVPCTKVDAVWFGFITIPLLSFAAFLFISVAMFAFWRLNKK